MQSRGGGKDAGTSLQLSVGNAQKEKSLTPPTKKKNTPTTRTNEYKNTNTLQVVDEHNGKSH